MVEVNKRSLTVHIDVHCCCHWSGQISICGYAGKLSMKECSIDGAKANFVSDSSVAQNVVSIINCTTAC